MVSMAGAWLDSFPTAADFSVDFAFTVLSLDTSSEVIGLLFSILDMIIIFNLIYSYSFNGFSDSTGNGYCLIEYFLRKFCTYAFRLVDLGGSHSS